MGLIARLLLNERAKFDRICGELQTARTFPEDVEEIRDILDHLELSQLLTYQPEPTE